MHEYVYAGVGPGDEDQPDPSHACIASAQLLITLAAPNREE
ncbi:hypothetical protein [Rhodococcus qingshengii]|nr:hypothetical protein [Rhodococcus qingshengii]